ncbi:MAG: aminotransferase class, partial [Dehalococcoidia bacterium]|nr:aminotransferase class [Dehalococcoidia bacterium]
DTSSACSDIKRVCPDLTFLCNPNNPTGVMLTLPVVKGIAKAAGPGYLLIDEAYAPLADSPWDTIPLLKEGNIILLRSMTKDFGLAGVRLGYMLASPEIIHRVRSWQYSWSVNAFAQAAGIAALGCTEHVRASREVIAQGKAFLQEKLPKLGLQPLQSYANFLLVRVGEAQALRERLLRRGFLVRDCASFGLPHHIRLSVRGLAECRRLVDALQEVVGVG